MASAPVAISGFDRPSLFKRWRPSGVQFLWLSFVVVQALVLARYVEEKP